MTGIYTLYFNKDCPLVDLDDGISRRILTQTANIMVVEVHFLTGAIAPIRNHSHEPLICVLSGEFEFTIGEETHRVSAGDTLYKQPHVMHG